MKVIVFKILIYFWNANVMNMSALLPFISKKHTIVLKQHSIESNVNKHGEQETSFSMATTNI